MKDAQLGELDLSSFILKLHVEEEACGQGTLQGESITTAHTTQTSTEAISVDWLTVEQ